MSTLLFEELRKNASSSDRSGSDGSSGGGLVGGDNTFWWISAINALLFLMMAAAAGLRVLAHLRKDSEASDSNRSPPDTVAISSKRRRLTQWIYTVLCLYAISRVVTEVLIAADVVEDVGSFKWSATLSLCSILFGLVQTLVISKWVQSVEDVVYEIRRSSFQLGKVAVVSSAIVLMAYTVMIVVSIVDHRFNLLPTISDVTWLEIVNLCQGSLYTFNGVCFGALGSQLLYYWGSASEQTRDARRRIMLMAALLCFVCVARGVILCIFSFQQDSRHLRSVMGSNWGAPVVLTLEWLCLALALFVLQPQRLFADAHVRFPFILGPSSSLLQPRSSPAVNNSSISVSSRSSDTPVTTPRSGQPRSLNIPAASSQCCMDGTQPRPVSLTLMRSKMLSSGWSLRETQANSSFGNGPSTNYTALHSPRIVSETPSTLPSLVTDDDGEAAASSDLNS